MRPSIMIWDVSTSPWRVSLTIDSVWLIRKRQPEMLLRSARRSEMMMMMRFIQVVSMNLFIIFTFFHENFEKWCFMNGVRLIYIFALWSLYMKYSEMNVMELFCDFKELSEVKNDGGMILLEGLEAQTNFPKIDSWSNNWKLNFTLSIPICYSSLTVVHNSMNLQRENF